MGIAAAGFFRGRRPDCQPSAAKHWLKYRTWKLLQWWSELCETCILYCLLLQLELLQICRIRV